MSEQAVRIGRLTVVAEPDRGCLQRRTERLASRGYEVRESGHFVVCRRPSAPGVVLLHTFREDTIDEDVSPLVADELGPAGIVGSADEYGRTLFAIVVSTCPPSLNCQDCGRLHVDRPAVWRHYCINTLNRLRPHLAANGGVSCLPATHIEQFGAVYRAISESFLGDSLLDVGCSLGFLPLLMAECHPAISITGCDNRPEAVAIASDLAAPSANRGVRFAVGDVLTSEFRKIGRFSTVTAVHLLEHLTVDELPTAIGNLLHVASRRLILAVPYEEKVQPLFGHEQQFTSATLESWGRWCIDRLGGGRYRCEHVAGGLLVVDLPAGSGAR